MAAEPNPDLAPTDGREAVSPNVDNLAHEDHRCMMSSESLIVEGTAACPGCGHMVKVRLVGGYPNGLWKFAEHSRHSGGECNDACKERTDA